MTKTMPSANAALLQQLVRYKAWADDRLFATIVTLPDNEISRERPTTFKTIGRTLHHTLIVEEMFKAHLEGRPHGYGSRTADTPPAMADLRRQVSAMNCWWTDYVDGLSDGAVTRSIDFEFVEGGRGTMTVLEIVLHIVHHATYHRGYVDDMLYQIPVTPEATDLPVYLCRS